MRGLGLGLRLDQSKGDPTRSLALPFSRLTALPDDVTFTRNDLELYWDEASGELRWTDHNYCKQSNDFDTTWGALGSTVTEDFSDFPEGVDGINSSWIITGTGGGSGTVGVFQASIAAHPSTPMFFSVYVKAMGLPFVRLLDAAFDGPGTHGFFDVENGARSTGTAQDWDIVDAGNGWYRCWIKLTTVTDLSGTVYIYAANSTPSSNVPKDSTSTIRIAGAQFTAGSLLPYVATTTAAIINDRPALGALARPTTTLPGLQLQPARINSCLYSRLAGGGAVPTGWTHAGGGPTGSPVASIYGDADGSAAYSVAVAGAQSYYWQSVTLTADHTYVYSVEVESVTGAIANRDVAYAANMPVGCTIQAWLVDGVASAELTAAKKGRLSIIVGGGYANGPGLFRFGAGIVATATATVKISRPMLESVGVSVAAANAVPSMFTPTDGVAMARNATTCKITGAAAAAIISDSAMTMFAHVTYQGRGSGALANGRYSGVLSNGSVNQFATLYNVGGYGGVFVNNATSGGTQMSQHSGIAVDANVPTKLALSLHERAPGSGKMTIDGTSYAEDTSVVMPDGVNQIGIGGLGYTAGSGGLLIHDFSIYKTDKSFAFQEALTS